MKNENSDLKENLIINGVNDKKLDKYSINVNKNIQNNIKNEQVLSNKICTSKYNIFNCFPKIIWEQFSKSSNLYFLALAILQMIPNISQSGGNPVMLIPLIFVVTVNGVKDLWEDYNRKISDNRENKSKSSVLISNEKIVQNWEDIKPGNIVKISKDEYFPADIVLLYSTNKNGVAYVETKNLDGETNLKYKESIRVTYRNIKNKTSEFEKEIYIKNIYGIINCDMPNNNMYEYEGIYYHDNTNEEIDVNHSNLSLDETKNNMTNYEGRLSKLDDIEDKQFMSNLTNLDYNNLLLRGSSLRNTDYIYGIVIYVGHNTKIMLNSLNARSKQSRVFKIMNSQLYIIILFQILLCLLFSLFYCFDLDNTANYENRKYYSFYQFFFTFFAWMLATNNIVPISLLVTVEMIKFCQAVLISWDYKIYDKNNRRQAIVQSSGLNEELGMVKHIFTDKTGTLTKNVMRFKYMVISETLYGSENHADFDELNRLKITNVDFNDNRLFDDWKSDHTNCEDINNFIFSLALCHSIIVENKDGEIVYNASSPDELALVNAAKYFGVTFAERTHDNYMIIKHNDRTFKYKLLHIFEFNSDRKRMSVIIKDENGNIKLLCKGADSVLFKISNPNSYSVQKKIIEYLEIFGNKGLRTLIIAERNISNEEYKNLSKELYKAYTSTKNKKELLKICYESVETDLKIVGATAIEDCLQDNLKPTLKAFQSIGIKIWMLTGDHPYTAVSIAHSCGLIDSSFNSIIINTNIYDEINQKLISAIDSFQKLCLVITGDALSIIQAKTSLGLYSLFLMAIKKSLIVICSRVTPKQKADLVLIVKSEEKNITTLAIGDGANDVNMITAADVGIGIMGNEGQQAARASDYVIGEFSFLRRLMFVHGREAYRKNSFAVGYILWKNCLYVVPTLVFGFFSKFSGQTIYDAFLDTFYNIIFTAYPIGWFATYDKEMNYDKLELDPKLYEIGFHNKLFNIYIFWRWYLYAATAGILMFILASIILSNCIYRDQFDLYTIGTSIYLCVVFVVNFKIFMETNTHNFLSVILFLFSTVSFILVIFFLSNLQSLSIFNVWNTVMNNFISLLTLLLIILACILVEYGWKSVHLILEQFIIINKKKIVPQIRVSTLSCDPLIEGEYEIKVAVEDSINNLKEDTNDEKNDLEDIILSESNTIMNNKGKYTGFAFVEDVANINIIKDNVKEDFYDNKQASSRLENE